MAVAETLGQVSLGLVAICYLMWITLPWSFYEMIEKRAPENKEAFESLEAATNEFFISSVLFLASTIMYASGASNMDTAQSIFLIVAGGFLILATVDTSKIIAYIFDKKVKMPVVSKIKFGHSIFDLEVLSSFILNFLLFLFLLSIVLHESFWGIRPSGQFIFALGIVSLILGVFLIGILIDSKKTKRWTWMQNIWAQLILGGIIVSPWAAWVFFTLGRFLGFW
jgi:hypothetical protein